MNKEHRAEVAKAVNAFIEALSLRAQVGAWSDLQLAYVVRASQAIVLHFYRPAIKEHDRRLAARRKGERVMADRVFDPVRRRSHEFRGCQNCGLPQNPFGGAYCTTCGQAFVPKLDRPSRLKTMADLGLIENIGKWMATPAIARTVERVAAKAQRRLKQKLDALS